MFEPRRCANTPGLGRHPGRGIDVAKRTCSVEGCERPHNARGFCALHLRRQRTGYPMDAPIRITHRRGTISTEARFWLRVDKNGPVPEHRPELGPCWLWTGGLSSAVNGYGSFRPSDGGAKVIKAHRFSFELENGPIPDGMEPDHLCRVRHCVRPSHLEAVTHWENMMRGVSIQAVNAFKTHCLRGHEFTPENTRIQEPFGRICRACRRIRANEYNRRKRAAR